MAAPIRVGRFEIVRELGRGAMGIVYLAHDPKIDRKVAIKTIQRNLALPETEAEEARQRFLREAQAAGRVIHQGIVTIFDVGEDQGLSYIAMEYVEGNTLEAACKSGSLLPVEKAVQMVIQACHALDYAHQNNIVHRDIKPANLMVIGGKQLKITDFGLAKNPAANLTSAGTLIGTPNYMSPEQIMGKALDGRSDLFSLGVVHYELLTGERPFGGDTISTIIYRILHEVPKTPETINPRVPAALSQVILKALDKDAAKRFQTGEEFAHALQGYLDSVSPPPGSVAFRASAIRPAPVAPTTAFPSAAGPTPAAGPVASAGAGAAAAKPAPVRIAPRPAAPPKRGSYAIPVVVVLLAGGIAAGIYFRLQIEGVLGLRRTPDSTPGQHPPESTPVPEVRPERPVLPPVEPPAPLPAGEVVSIRVETDPPGGTIRLDDREVTGGTVVIGKTDTMSHTLVGMNECREGRVAVRANGPESVAVPLSTPRLHKVRVNSEPTGATVALDGRDTRLQTPADLSVTACEAHTISARTAGHRDAERKFDAKTVWASAPTVSLALEKLPDGFVSVKAPYAVEVLEAGRSIGSAGAPLKLPAGRHTLTFVNKDLFVEVSGDVDVPPEGTVPADVEFPGVGQLTVLANPGDGTVYINGRRIGSLPFIGHPLAEGTYTLKYALDSGRSEEKTVLVIAGQSKTEKFIFN